MTSVTLHHSEHSDTDKLYFLQRLARLLVEYNSRTGLLQRRLQRTAQALGNPADWLIRAQHDRCLPDVQADYAGIELPDRFVFGFGMDVSETLRPLPAIYAMKQ